MKKYQLNGIKLSLLGLALTAQHLVQAEVLTDDRNTPMQSNSKAAMPNDEENLASLLNTHGILLNQAILAALNNASPEVVDAGKQKLLANSKMVSNLFSSQYGLQVGHQFQSLFDQHILIGSQYIDAVKNRDMNLEKQASSQALANGNMIAEFLSQILPSVPYKTWQQMLEEHVMMEAEQTKAYFQGDAAKASNLKSQSLMQLAELAKLITNAMKNKHQP
jgi:hypothetical protein